MIRIYRPVFNILASLAALAPLAAQTSEPASPPNPAIEERLERAQGYFQEGKRLLQDGRHDESRVQFDRAIELLLNTPADAADRAQVERRLEELVDLISRYDLDDLGSAEPRENQFDQAPLDEIRDLTFPLDPKQKGLARHQVSGMISQIPLETNDAVLGYINYFSSTKLGRNTLINGWRRSTRYRPMIQRILAEEGVPQELIYLAQAESGFLPRARSYRAACGMWQFVSWRGNEYGLSQDKYVDLRLDPEKSTRAAARHLKDLYEEFGDWYLAMAAYNCGPGCVARAVERTGYADYWELRRRGAIPKETSNYVPIIVAMTIVATNAAEYGIVLDDPAPPLEYDVLKVESPTNIELIAGAADLPVSGIRDLNPALLRSIAPEGHEVRIPRGQLPEIVAAIETVPVAQRASYRIHRVKPGESLSEIAQTYKTSLKTLLAQNNSYSMDSVAEGDMLIVPASKEAPVRQAVRRKSSSSRTATKAKTKAGARPAVQRGAVQRGSGRAAR